MLLLASHSHVGNAREVPPNCWASGWFARIDLNSYRCSGIADIRQRSDLFLRGSNAFGSRDILLPMSVIVNAPVGSFLITHVSHLISGSADESLKRRKSGDVFTNCFSFSSKLVVHSELPEQERELQRDVVNYLSQRRHLLFHRLTSTRLVERQDHPI